MPAIWNMATYGGKRAAVLGLWATYPAETINGLVVSDRLFNFLFQGSTPDVGVVSPAERDAWATRCARAGGGRHRIRRPARATSLPSTEAEYQQYARVGRSVRASGERAAAHPDRDARLRRTRARRLQREHPDLTIVYLQGTDTIGHTFAAVRAAAAAGRPGRATSPDTAACPNGTFARSTSDSASTASSPPPAHAVLMLASDHGFAWKDDRPVRPCRATRRRPPRSGTARKGSTCCGAPGFQPAPGHPDRGTVSQVCATLLALLGLPPARDTENRVLTGRRAAGRRGDRLRRVLPSRRRAGSRPARRRTPTRSRN